MLKECEICHSLHPYDESCKMCHQYYLQDLENGMIAEGMPMKDFSYETWIAARLAENEGLSPKEVAGRAKTYEEHQRKQTAFANRCTANSLKAAEDFRKRHGYK